MPESRDPSTTKIAATGALAEALDPPFSPTQKREEPVYDEVYRLKSADRSAGTPARWRFAYDAAGNRTGDQTDDAAMGATFNNVNELQARQPGGVLGFRGTTNEPASVTVAAQPAQTAVDNSFRAQTPAGAGTTDVAVAATDPAGNLRTNTYRVTASGAGTTYTYDPNGNLATKTEGTDNWTYSWNAENQLTKVEKNGVEQARFAYDPMGRRVEKVTNGEATSYVNDQTTILRETRGASKWLYVHGVGLDEPLESSTSAATSYFHADGLGSIVTQTTADGSPTLSRQYDAWGTLEVGAGAPGYSFTGREWDSEVGLYHYRARYYDPRMGRFVSEDPVHFRGGLNFYVYADAQPTTVTDPSGHEPMPLPPGMVPTNWVTFFCREYGFCPRPPPPPPPPPRGCDGTPCTPRTDWWAYFGCLMYNAPKPETFYSAPKAVTGGGLHLRCWMASQVCAEGGLQCFCGSHDGPSGPGTPQVPHNRGPSGPAAPGWHGGR